MLENYLHYPEAYKEDYDLALNDAAIETDYPEIDLTKKVKEDLSELKIKLRLKGGYQVSVYNQPEDDKEGNWYSEALAKAYPDSCFVKAAVNGSIKGLDAQLVDLDFGIKGNGSLIFFDYRKFLAATPFEKALDDMRKNYRLILRREDVMKLAPGERLGMTYEGKLSAALELSLGDVYQMALNVLKSMLPADKGIEISCSPKLSASFNCSWHDEFALDIEHKDDEQYAASVKKVRNRSYEAAGSIAVKLGLGKEAWWDTLLDHMSEAFLGTTLKEWDALLGKETASWNDAEKKLAAYVLKRLGWEVDMDKQDILQEKYKQLRKDLSEKIEAFLKQEIALEIGVAYERIKEQEVLLEATLTSAALKKLHAHLVKGNWDKLSGAEGVTYEKFLQKKLTRKNTKCGVGLSLGSLQLFSRGTYEYKEEKNSDRRQKPVQEHIAISTQRAHEEKMRDKYSYYIQLQGETPGFVVKPHAGMFDFRWQTHWENTQRKIREEEMEQYVDWAVLWRCIPEYDRKKVMQKWRDELRGEKKIKVALDLVIPSGIFDMLVPLLQNPPHQYVVQSLAEAVPYKSSSMRTSQKKRAAVYYRIWDRYLQMQTSQPAIIAALAEELLDTVDPSLAAWEGLFTNRQLTADNGWMSMAGILDNNPVVEHIERLQQGMEFMHQAMLKHKDYRVPFKQGFKRYRSILMMNGVNDTFNLRFMGRYLLNLAHKAGVLEEVNTTFTLQKEEEQLEVYTSS